ncbi:hypothetical protein LXM94_16630 [Rhizobium sp. TRM95111]|uniref:hypothetical protein n=1 Tax=Rhizobium alarense TaxID=2846851 RepID=UPI001F1A348B|nr:hypothetical protein [Rhizobium alarense]MCF3641600.1 hypothetical protein [Rhizobium alarense]
MSADGLPNRALLPVEAATGGASSPISQIVAGRIGSETAMVPDLSVDRQVLTGLRKVAPHGDTAHPTVFQPSGAERTPGILDRIVSFFVRPGNDAPETDTIRVADDPRRTKSGDKVHDLNTAVDRLEQSQQFATGMTLMSSLTQSVMSSSRRLTQGQ